MTDSEQPVFRPSLRPSQSSMASSQPLAPALAEASDTAHPGAASGIHQFPPELLIECVKWLDDSSDDRIYVSQVSKLWREALLAAPNLWTTIDIRPLSHPAAVERLRIFLDRSAPLDVHLLVGLAGAGETQLIEANVARFGALSLKWRLEPEEMLWTLTWPRLTRLEIRVDLFQSPEGWGGDHMPGLETFTLRSFLFSAPTTPFAALRSFDGRMGLDEGEFSDARALFTLCPNLVSLALAEVWDPAYLPQGAPPETLRDVRLDSAYGRAIDLSDYLRPWVGHAFRTIFLQSSVLAVPLQLFVSPHNGPWKLTASTEEDRPAVIQAQELGGGPGSRLLVQTSLRDLDTPGIFNEGFAPQAMRLTVLVMGGHPLLALLQANLTLPALVELTHRDKATYIGSDIGVLLNPDSDSELPTIMHTPVLRHLIFELAESTPDESDAAESEGSAGDSDTAEPQQLTAVYLKSYISTCIRYQSPRLESITVVGHLPETLRSAGVDALAALATSVYGQCTPSDEKTLMFSHGE